MKYFTQEVRNLTHVLVQPKFAYLFSPIKQSFTVEKSVGMGCAIGVMKSDLEQASKK